MTNGDLLIGINEPQDPRNLSDLEKRHLPMINAPDVVARGRPFEVTVEIGQLLSHPWETAHFVQFVDLYADQQYLARATFGPQTARPKVTFTVALTRPAAELRAYGLCNMHGTWLGRLPIQFQD